MAYRGVPTPAAVASPRSDDPEKVSDEPSDVLRLGAVAPDGDMLRSAIAADSPPNRNRTSEWTLDYSADNLWNNLVSSNE